MTGYGAAEAAVAGGRLRVEVRTVNHRYFNLALRWPDDLALLEAELREVLRKEFDRGHVAVQGRWVERTERHAPLALDLDRARQAADRLRELQAALVLPGQVTLELVARQPDVLGTAPPAAEAAVAWADVAPIVGQAVAECRAMRRKEGAVLAAELEHRLALMAERCDAVAGMAPGRLERERDRLRAAVAQLLDGRAVDETRLAQELAFLADKLDITEELVRFRAHVAACREALGGNDAVGKRLGFLAQELGREVNTMGSKANDAAITAHVVAMKGELEKFREQLENLE
ncbi:MAG TPA: YicC/YloC family endoribonuclease [Gemmatimonadales bacterium]|nr:YicC/YloC family endoribonuclease [Gemmatimonadales bacterium]